MNTKELLEEMQDLKEARERLTPDMDTIIGLIHLVKRHFAEMGQHYSYEELRDAVDDHTDQGIRLLEAMDELVMEALKTEREKVTASSWTPVEEALPPYHKDVLFCNKVGQVFHGFLEEYDGNKPYLTEDGKISFEKYEDGGAWYNFRFRTYEKMRSVVAWRELPECYMPEKYDVKRKRMKKK